MGRDTPVVALIECHAFSKTGCFIVSKVADLTMPMLLLGYN